MGAVLSIIKVLPAVFPVAIEAIKLVEKVFGKGKGSEKRAYVVQLVKVAILAAENISQKDIVDEEKFSEGVGKVVDGVVDVLNSTGKFGPEGV